MKNKRERLEATEGNENILVFLPNDETRDRGIFCGKCGKKVVGEFAPSCEKCGRILCGACGKRCGYHEQA